MPGFPRGAALLPLLFLSPRQAPQAPRLLDRCNLDPAAAVSVELPRYVTEASGLATTAEGRLLTHGDDLGRVAELDSATLQPVGELRLRSAPRADFEGIAVVPGGGVLMTSEGILYFLGEKDGESGDGFDQYGFERVDTGFGRVCELEGLAYDAASGVLLLPCKVAIDPRLENAFIIFRWSLERRAPAQPDQIFASRSRIARLVRTTQFRATSVEWDAVSGHVLVLSSHPAVIVELAGDGSVVGAVALDPRRHPQAEGLTLVGNRLLIADEGVNKRGTITAYTCGP
jgi:uncharacterized protein YjiK